MGKELAKTRIGKICAKHPEMKGLRRETNYTCVQCDREKSAARSKKMLEASGKSPRVLYTPEEAAQRIRERDKIRSRKRRQSAEYNAKQIERKREWREKNKERYLASSRVYDAKQRKENIQRRLSKNLRHRIYKAVLGKTKGVSAVRDLGMSIPDFKNYIESLFRPGMSWDNYGEWHLDHKKPLISFDLTDINQAKQACHYSNIQPLWAIENQKKHGKENFDVFLMHAREAVNG